MRIDDFGGQRPPLQQLMPIFWQFLGVSGPTFTSLRLNSNEEDAWVIPLLIQEGWRAERRGGYPCLHTAISTTRASSSIEEGSYFRNRVHDFLAGA